MSEGVTTIILAKNCGASLRKCLESLRPFVTCKGDEVIVLDTGSTDANDTVNAAKAPRFTLPGFEEEQPCRLIERPDLCVPGLLELVRQYLPLEASQKVSVSTQLKDGFLADFAAARQIATDAANNDLIFWIDSDDVLVNGAALREYIDQHFANDNAPDIFIRYDYQFGPDGAVTTTLMRERVCRRSRSYWAGCCHEAMIPRDGRPRPAHTFHGAWIEHRDGRPDDGSSDVRNYAILRKAVDDAQAANRWIDPRWEFYLGNACRGMLLLSESIVWFCRMLERSGSRDDRFAAACHIANAFATLGRPWKAIDWFLQATKINPHDSRAYLGLASCYYDLKRYQDALLYSTIVLELPPIQGVQAYDPNAQEFYPHIIQARCYKELGNEQAALASAMRASAVRPELGAAIVEEIQRWVAGEQLKSSVAAVCSLATSREAMLEVIGAIKPEIRKDFPDLQVETYVPESKKTITYLCSKTLEPWDGSSVNDGVGGSEKMVINLSRHWAKLGYDVRVYGNPKPANRYKKIDGVTYLPVESFNPTLKRRVVIVWRHWGLLDLNIRAKAIFMDLHDVQNPAELTPERLRRLKGIFFKSQFHLDPVRTVPGVDALAIVSRNGIEPEHFSGPKERKPKSILYTSSGDRGLLRALRIFERVKAIHPDATFDFFYGFTPLYTAHAAAAEYRHFEDLGHEMHMLDYSEACFSLADRLGARCHGRIGHEALAAFLRRASVVLYPTGFPEISCMSAMEAQAAGAIYLTTLSGALPETVEDRGVTLPVTASDDHFVRAIDGVFRKGADLDPARAACSETAIARFNNSSLATEWLDKIYERTPA